MYSSSAPAVSGHDIDEAFIDAFEETTSSIYLELDVTDPESVREISGKKAGRERTEYALNALTVGLLSLRHARGQVDADAVRREGERILGEMESSLENYREKIADGMTFVLKEYFDPNSGSFQQRVERLIQKDGDLEQLLRRQVGAEGSELAAALATHVGANSPIMNVLDPTQTGSIVNTIRQSAEDALKAESERILSEFSLDNKSGSMSRMVAELTENNGKLTGDLSSRINEAVAEFSLDKEDSALSRLMRNVDAAQRTITSEFSLDNSGSCLARLREELLTVFDAQNEKNSKFQSDVAAALEAMKARRAESLRSTRHGNDFETAVVEFVTLDANRASDITTAVGSTCGLIKNCKVGDAVVELGPDCAAAGAKYVVEAKESTSYDMTKARKELETARMNRGAAVGVFVFSKEAAPANLESISRYGDDVFVVWDANDPSSDVILKSALSLAKAMCVRESTKRNAEAAEFAAIDDAILAIEKEAKRLDEMRKWTETIRNNSDKVLESVRKMADGLQSQVGKLRDAVEGLSCDG
ncbi:MAG: hypothetical protein AB7F88_04195 [Pyrinomonadaceae bacterium]